MLMRPPSSARMAIFEALALGADEVRRRHPAIVEIHHGRGLAVPAEFLLLGAEAQPRRTVLDHETRDALRSVVAGAHHADVQVAARGAGNERLGAVDHIVVAVTHRPGRQSRGVGPGPRFGQAIAGDLVHGRQGRQPLAALIAAAVGVDHRRRHVVDREERRRRRAAGGQGLEDHRPVEAPEIGAADVIGHEDRREAQFGGLRKASTGNSQSSSQRGGMGRQIAGREIPGQGLERPLVLVELETMARLYSDCALTRQPQ